ncbi:ankyrin repeat domain-containing protein 26 isoform X9 [Amphiprion ocellaris]|uniref:ankyrin repeat domain-containing protein 26 isoform X9 n=1 Tax=Amphiprion ocellaris TaxID=80972 RepID=UPI002410DB49|nr:ankyrin repeat domain-containing protein 26 isoform X9 [Amphiprion ocellaris]
MKKIFSFTKKKKHPSGTPDNGSVLSVGYELKDKDLGKVHKAASVGDLAKLKQLAKKNDINQLDKENRTALHIACASGHGEVVQFLVESKAKLNLCDNQNRSALMKAGQGQYEHCVNILLENHAEPNLVDINGNTALHLAANIPSISTAVLLLQHGAEINAQNKEGFTPLTVAVREDHIEMAEFLLKESADVNFMDQDRRSPLMIAAGNGQINMVRLLLQFDADITLKDTKGWSADDHAGMNGHHPCSLLISEHGTQRNDGASLSLQGPSNKKKKMLGSPSQDVEAGFSLGGPATDKDEHGANEAGGDFEDNSQSESLSRMSKSAADEWPSSEDDDESVSIDKKKLNLSKMIASKKGKAEQGKGKHSEQPSSSKTRSDSQEDSAAEDSEEDDGEEEEEEEEEEEDDDDEDNDEDEEEDEDEDEEEDEDDDDDDEDEDDEESQEEEGEENEEENGSVEDEDDQCVATVKANTTVFNDVQKPSVTGALEIIDSADGQNMHDTGISDSGTLLDVVCENPDSSEKDAKIETQNTDLLGPAEAMPATLNVVEDCVVSAIRVESKFSDEDESLGKECLGSIDQNIISNQSSTGGPVPTQSHIKEEEIEREAEKDDDDSWSDRQNSGDTVWNDSDTEEDNQTGGFGRNTLLANQRYVLPEVDMKNPDSLSDGEDDTGSNKKAEKRRSSWGSSLEDNDSDKENEVNSEILDQTNNAKAPDLQPEATSLHSKITTPQPNEDPRDTSWDSSSPVPPSPKCNSPKQVIDDQKSFLGKCLTSSPQPKNKPGRVTADESEWDSSENKDQNDSSPNSKCEVVSPISKPKVIAANQTREQQGHDKESIEKESNDPSPAVSPIADNVDVESAGQLSQMSGKLDSENENNDSSWDDEDESDESEKQKTKKMKDDEDKNCGNAFTTVLSDPTNLSRPISAIDKKEAKIEDNHSDEGNEVVPHSVVDGSDESAKDIEPDEDKQDDETSEDSDSMDQKLQYDFASATVKVCDDEHEARLTAYAPLENISAIATRTKVSSDDLNEEPIREKSPPTKDDVTAGHHTLSDEMLPQTDIDDVDLDSPDEAENTGMGWPEQKGIPEPEIKKEDSTEDGDDDDKEAEQDEAEEGDISDEDGQPEESGESLDAASTVTETQVSKDNERDFRSELGLEKGEDEQDSWDSESHSDHSNIPHEQKQNLQTQEAMSTAEEEIKENLFYTPSFLRGERGNRMAILEPWRGVGWQGGRQGEVGNNSNDDNRGEEDIIKRKENEKAKWEPLSVLSKLEGDANRQKDLMEELGLGDVDDLEAQKADASDWDSASTTSKRTLPGRRMTSPELEESPKFSNSPVKEQDEDVAPTAALTPQRSISSDKKLPSTPSRSVPHPQPRARKMVLQKPESEEESDWEPDKITSPFNETQPDNELQNIAALPEMSKPGSPELLQMAKESESGIEVDEQQQQASKDTTTTTMQVQKSSASWDTGHTALEEVGTEKPETRLGSLSTQTGAAIHQEQLPVAAKSTTRAPEQLQPPIQQTCNSNIQEKQAVEETLQLELVRGARRSRAPQTNTHVNGDPLSVFDDSTLSEVSDDEGRLPPSGQQKSKNTEEVEMAEDFDELTQSSDTATDDIDSPTSGYRHASLLIQKLDSATLDSRSMVKLQNIFHEYERSIQKARSRHGYLADKVNQLEVERAEMKSSMEEVKDVKSALERNQLELQTEVTNLKFQLKQEQENRRNATMMYNTTRDKLRRTEEQHQLEVQERQKVELTLRNLELEMRTLVNNMKQLEEDHSETQRLLAQERSARTLQENLLNSHLRKQQEIEEESKRNMSKSNEALSQLTEASDRERELVQQTATLQEQLTILRTDIERLQANSSLKESHLTEENEALKEQLEDVRRDLKLNSEALTQTVFSCNNQLTTLKSELAITTTRMENERQTRETLEAEVESTRTRLAGAVKEAELCRAAHTDTEKALLREKEEHQRLKDRLTGEAASQRQTVSSLSQKLAQAESQNNSMENEVHQVRLQLTEKGVLLEVLQREKDQAAARVKELETALQAKRELVSRAGARQEATQERLAQAQSEGMLLRQQLEEAQNKGVAKERAVTDAQERFSDILSKLRSDCEERVQLVEDRNKELASKAADLRDQIYKLEEEKNERETSLRQRQQELADSLKKLSMSEASLEVNTRYRNDLEEEKARLFKDLDRLKGKLEESEDQYVQAERRINSLKSSLDEREKELTTAAQKHQEALFASAASDITIKQLEEAVQRLEIDNARLEAAAKQQSNKIEALQKGAQEAVMQSDCSPGGGVRGHLEELVTTLQSSKMTLEDQLSREVQKQSVLSHTAQDSQALWEEELKSRSKLGLRLAELEKEKGELNTQMEMEKKKVKKIAEQKKAVDARLDQEMKRNTDLQKEMYRLRSLLKTAKKKLRDQDGGGGEFGSPMSSLRMDLGRHSQGEGAVGRMRDKVDDLQVQLEKEASLRSHLEKVNGDLKDQLASLNSLNRSNDQLERSKRQLEEEVLDLRRRMEATQVEQSHVEQYRRDAEERARQEVQQKLEQVNLFLQSQAASQEALDQIKAANEANLRSLLEQKIRELEGELGRARITQQDSVNQRDSTRTELERYRQLYAEELRLRKSLAAKLDRANSRLSDANSKLLNERSRSLITSNITNGSLGGPSLDLGALGSAAHYGATLGPLNRSLGLGLSLLSPASERQNSQVEDYLAKMQSELDRNISKELSSATAELDAASERLSPVGSASRVELDPVSRATQQYLEVLKKNNRI